MTDSESSNRFSGAMHNALFLCDDKETIVRLSDVFRETGFAVTVVQRLSEVRSALLREVPDVAVLDYDILEAEDLEFLESSGLGNVIELILVTANPKLADAVRGMRAGASDYLEKPIDQENLRSLLEKLSAPPGTPDVNASGTEKARGLGLMHGESRLMQRLFKMLRKVSVTDMTVLLVGESGVGKELAARIIHELSHRSAGPMLPVNCGAISPEILESELFGHEKGAFTGASKRHAGFFERAQTGTLFLDEITEMSPGLQVKLLRVLETGYVRRVGGEREISIDVRILAATNRDPEEAVKQGVLREDLYYRLAQFPVRVPALRDREDDVLLLARLFLDELTQAHGVEKRFSDEALELMRLHSWPGNVRELKNAVSRAYVLAGQKIQPDDLPSSVIEGRPVDGDYLRIAVGMPLVEVERRAILATVEHMEGNKKAAAKALGVSLKTLYTKLKKYRQE